MPAAPSPVAIAPAAGAGKTGADHLYWLDWLRFVAALLVMFDHTRETNWPDWHGYDFGIPRHLGSGAFLALCQLGRVAVIVFFVLSGLLVGGKTLARVRRGTFDPASYAADRLSRVYVPLIPALALTALAGWWCGKTWYPGRYLACLAGLQEGWVFGPVSNPPLWTLAYETWFYVLAGCAATACMRGLSPWARVAAGTGAALALANFLKLDGLFLICWLMGVAGFWLDARLGALRRGWLALAGAAVAAGGTAFYEMDRGILPTFPGYPAPWMPQSDLWLLAVAAGATLSMACLMRRRPTTPPGAWAERLGSRLATLSYTLYLTHFPVLNILAAHAAKMPPRLDGPSLGRAAVWMAVCIAVALGMYALFESRTLAVRRWLRAIFAPATVHRPVFGQPFVVVR